MDKSTTSFFGSSNKHTTETKSETKISSDDSYDKQSKQSSSDRSRNSNDCDGNVCWPVIIFVVIVIIILICLFCSAWSHRTKTLCAAGLILFLIIWALVIWFFCRSQGYTAAWFFLILPIAIIIFWLIARFLAQATNCGCQKHADVC